jgi:hypothetical protein
METYYKLVVDGKDFFVNNNTACFAEITSSYNKDITLPYLQQKPEFQKMSCEFLTQGMTEDKVSTFLKKCRSFGVKTSYRQIEDPKEWHPKAIGDGQFIVTLKFKDYKSVNHIKFGLHVARTLVEDQGAVAIFCRPTPIGVEHWQHFRIACSIGGVGHNYFGGLCWMDYNGKAVIYESPRFKEIDERVTKSSFHQVAQEAARLDKVLTFKVKQDEFETFLFKHFQKTNKQTK